MTGSLQVKNGVYYMVVNTKNAEGKRKQKWITTKLPVKGNKRKAEQQLNAYLAECTQKGYIEPSKLHFCDYLAKWVEMHKKNVQPKTHETNIRNLKRHIYPYFNAFSLNLSDVKSEAIQAYCDAKLGEGLNPNTVIRHYAIIRAALTHAYKSKMIRTNPCDWVDKPKSKKYFAEFYTPEEIKHLLGVFKGTYIEVPVYIAAYLGLRRSEVIGLRWRSVDMVNGSLTVCNKVIRMFHEGKLTNMASNELKTESSYRILPLDETLMEMFKAIKEQQERNKQLCGNSYSKEYSDYVCVNAMGDLINPETVSKYFSKIIRKNGMKAIRYHDLRHSCASMLLSLGYSMKEIQEWLGHSNYNTTAEIYSHVDPRNKSKMIRGITAALSAE